MLNVRNTIADAYRIALNSETTDATEYNIGLDEINDVIYQLNIEHYLTFTRTEVDFITSGGKLEFTIGTSGCDITADRPVAITAAYIRANESSIFQDLTQVSIEDLYKFRRSNAASGLPSFFAYDPKFPNGTIKFDVNIQGGATVTLVYDKEFPELELNDKVTTIPNEYNDLIKNMLAESLMVRNKIDTTQVSTRINDTKVKIKRKIAQNKRRTWATLNNYQRTNSSFFDSGSFLM